MIPYNPITKNPAEPSKLFSICTIVNNHDEYLLMKESFENCGFKEQCEYLIADNTISNQFNAYEAISRFIKESQGKYLVVVHQDVRCIDQQNDLINCLDNLTQLDDKWAICGNAGGKGHHQNILHINSNGKIIQHTNLPAKVHSLDENLLIIKKATNITISPDLGGFHLYGADLCLIADFLGYSSYVIPFMVKHLSTGNLKDLKKHVPAFVNAYGRKLRSRYIQTTCTNFYLSCSVFNNKLYNFPPVYFFVKAYQRLKFNIKLIAGKYPHKEIITYETGTAAKAN
jgi:hypothetical protein